MAISGDVLALEKTFASAPPQRYLTDRSLNDCCDVRVKPDRSMKSAVAASTKPAPDRFVLTISL